MIAIISHIRSLLSSQNKLLYMLPILLGVIAGCSTEDEITSKPGVITLSAAFVNEFDLIDHHGAPAPNTRFEGKPTLIYYGFTTCPDVCPTALGVITRTLDELGTRAAGLNALFITIDPERDTPEVLKTHLAFDSRILGLTGTPEALETARSNIRLFAQKVVLPESAIGYTMDHQSFFYIIDKAGTAQFALIDQMTPSDIASVLKKYL